MLNACWMKKKEEDFIQTWKFLDCFYLVCVVWIEHERSLVWIVQLAVFSMANK